MKARTIGFTLITLTSAFVLLAEHSQFASVPSSIPSLLASRLRDKPICRHDAALSSPSD